MDFCDYYKKNVKLLSVLFIASITFSFITRGQILVVKTNQKNQPIALDESDRNNYLGTQQGRALAKGSHVFDHLLYQWPTNLLFASSMMQSEKNELFAQEADAETSFIKKKIQASHPTYDVIVIPDTIYQLFVLYYYFNNPSDSTMSTLYSYLYNFFDNFALEWDESHYNPTVKLISTFFDQCKAIYDNPIVAQASFLINCKLGEYYVPMQGTDAKVIAADLMIKIMHDYENNKSNFSEEQQKHHEEGGFNFDKLKQELKNGALSPDGIINNLIDLESKARNKNQALLMRGTKPFYQATKFYGSKEVEGTERSDSEELLESTLMYSTVQELVTAYEDNTLEPHAICYGTAPFIGGLYCKWDMPYDYATKAENYFYALPISKKAYVDNNCNNLFIIPPFSALTQIFGHESMYHVVSKVAMKQVPDEVVKINGFEPTHDMAGILLIQRDPIKHAQLCSDFLSKNVVMLKVSEEKQTAGVSVQVEQDRLRNNLAQASRFYGEFFVQSNAAQAMKVSTNVTQEPVKAQQAMHYYSSLMQQPIDYSKDYSPYPVLERLNTYNEMINRLAKTPGIAVSPKLIANQKKKAIQMAYYRYVELFNNLISDPIKRNVDLFDADLKSPLLKALFSPQQLTQLTNLLAPSLKAAATMPLLYQLLNDMNNYKTTNKFAHAGDLYEHSIWTEQVAAQWLDEKTHWSLGGDNAYADFDEIHTKGLASLGEHEKKIVALTALLHDVGKGGDHRFSFHNKKEHARAGFEYILGIRNYILKNGQPFDFKAMFKQLGINEQEQKLIAILIGMHLSFGEGVMERAATCKGSAEEYYNVVHMPYCKELSELTQEAGYNNGDVDEELLKMAVFIGVADAKGNQSTPGTHSIIFESPLHLPAVRKTDVILYDHYLYDDNGKARYSELLSYFKTWKESQPIQAQKSKKIGKTVVLSAKEELRQLVQQVKVYDSSTLHATIISRLKTDVQTHKDFINGLSDELVGTYLVIARAQPDVASMLQSQLKKEQKRLIE